MTRALLVTALIYFIADITLFLHEETAPTTGMQVLTALKIIWAGGVILIALVE